MKCAWIEAQRKLHPLPVMCGTLAVTGSGYRAWQRGGSPRFKRLSDTQLLALIEATPKELKGAYGSPRMLRARVFTVSKLCVECLARERHPWTASVDGIGAFTRRRPPFSTAASRDEPARSQRYPERTRSDVVDGLDLRVDRRELALPGDGAGTLQPRGRRLVDQPRTTTDIALDALTMAWLRRRPAPGLIHHFDRGSAHASHAVQGKLADYGMICSVSRKANCWDNAPTESFFNILKNERVHGARYATRAQAVLDLFDCIEVFYNRSRRHSALGYRSPVQFLRDWIARSHFINGAVLLEKPMLAFLHGKTRRTDR